VARQLIELGFDAVALEGGYNAWRQRFPVEAKGETQDTKHET
jgi:rhodanese-related sulfurtransferase